METELLYTPAAVAIAFSWLAELIPAVKTRIAPLTSNQKRLLFAGVAIVASALVTWLSCRGWWIVTECPVEGFREYLSSIFAGLIAMKVAREYGPRTGEGVKADE